MRPSAASVAAVVSISGNILIFILSIHIAYNNSRLRLPYERRQIQQTSHHALVITKEPVHHQYFVSPCADVPDSQEIQSRQCSDGYIELDPLQAEVTRVAKHHASTPGPLIQVWFIPQNNGISVAQAAHYISSACEHGEVYKITQIRTCRTMNA